VIPARTAGNWIFSKRFRCQKTICILMFWEPQLLSRQMKKNRI
jgi:hypothetical protein